MVEYQVVVRAPGTTEDRGRGGGIFTLEPEVKPKSWLWACDHGHNRDSCKGECENDVCSWIGTPLTSQCCFHCVWFYDFLDKWGFSLLLHQIVGASGKGGWRPRVRAEL